MSIQRLPITPCGYRKLEAELKEYREVKRPANIRAIEEARAHGDLSENAEYHAAKEEQAYIAAKIRELEDQIARAQIIDPAKLSGVRITFGATVTLFDIDTDEEFVYTLVGPTESDVKKGKISVVSPIGRGLIGKELDEEVKIKTPNGIRHFEITDVEFKPCED